MNQVFHSLSLSLINFAFKFFIKKVLFDDKTFRKPAKSLKGNMNLPPLKIEVLEFYRFFKIVLF